MTKTVYHFSQANPKGSSADIPTLLRRVADSIDERKGATIHDVILGSITPKGENPSISVYYSYPEGVAPPAVDEKYEMKVTQVEVNSEEGDVSFSKLVDKAKEHLEAAGEEAEVYDVSLNDVLDENGERLILTIYYD